MFLELTVEANLLLDNIDFNSKSFTLQRSSWKSPLLIAFIFTTAKNVRQEQ